MKNQYKLWRVSNGWMLVPEGTTEGIAAEDAHQVVIFKSLQEFADYKPKRVRKSKKPKKVSNETFNEMKGMVDANIN